MRSFFLLCALVAVCNAVYTGVAYYDINAGCTGVAYRTSYTQTASCTPIPCTKNTDYQLSILQTCVSAIPQTKGTLEISSYPSHDCSGTPDVGVYNLNTCLPDEQGQFGYLTCNAQYICSDSACKSGCTATPFSDSCTATPRDSTTYKCIP
uniref:Plasmin C n=1 Tax=Physarum polycephalum TaxID=5791 RepID=PLSC_PHYPO|nr:RecName: Full=Plasmin C; Flags: Precursor [Physarum polycephalum]CAA37633.1 precursor peptide [Physarum polycephalum]